MNLNWKVVVVIVVLLAGIAMREQILAVLQGLGGSRTEEVTPASEPQTTRWDAAARVQSSSRLAEMDAASRTSRDAGTRGADVSGRGAAERAERTLKRTNEADNDE